MRPEKIVAMVVAVALLLALAPWPYFYYQLLRVIVCGGGIFCGIALWNSSERGRALAIALFITALVFNPLIPVHLARAAWSIINVLSAALFGYLAIRKLA